MRSDYALYIVAIIFFAITGISFVFVSTELERNLSVVTTAVLGLLFAGLGYSLKPKHQTIVASAVPVAPTIPPPPPKNEDIQEKTVEVVAEKTTPYLELSVVKGIKEKRVEQLKAVGISTVQDLANASAEKLATKLKISPKFTEKWIHDAKELVKKP